MSLEKDCFVISPIGEEGSETRERSDKVLDGLIRPVANEMGYEVERADESTQPGSIPIQVVQRLLAADLVIADLTDHNPNVFYELAVRHATGNPVIQIIDTDDSLPFDIFDQRTIPVSTTDVQIWEDAKESIRGQIEEWERESDAGGNPISTAIDLSDLYSSNSQEDKVSVEILEKIQTQEQILKKIHDRIGRTDRGSGVHHRSSHVRDQLEAMETELVQALKQTEKNHSELMDVMGHLPSDLDLNFDRSEAKIETALSLLSEAQRTLNHSVHYFEEEVPPRKKRK